MPSYYIENRLCSVCLGARRLGGETCEHCSGTGHEPKPEPVIAQRTLSGERLPQLPHLGNPFPEKR